MLLMGCSRRDAKLAHQVAGTWNREGIGTWSYSPQGNFLISWQRDNGTNQFAGTWQVKAGVLIMKLTNSPIRNGHSLFGLIEKYNIVCIDKNDLIYEMAGETNKISR